MKTYLSRFFMNFMRLLCLRDDKVYWFDKLKYLHYKNLSNFLTKLTKSNFPSKCDFKSDEDKNNHSLAPSKRIVKFRHTLLVQKKVETLLGMRFPVSCILFFLFCKIGLVALLYKLTVCMHGIADKIICHLRRKW